MTKRITQTIIKNCKVHGETEFAVITGTNKSYCRKCKLEQTNKRRNFIKQQCYEYLGNKCSCCNKVYSVYDFHHKNPKEKEYNINQGLNKKYSFDKLKLELDKCILLCGNCHAEFHYNEDLKPDIKLQNSFKNKLNRNNLKEKAINYLGGKCSICGYNKCKNSLVFHHKDSDEKEFNIGDKIMRNFSFIKLQKEPDKCILLCRNCHLKEHNKNKIKF